jgi:hypothetical protein
MRGQCVSSQSYRDLQTGIIWTRYQIQASEWYKGAGGSILTVTEPGGIVNGIGQWMPGACQFIVGEDIILFLFKTELGKWRVRGQGQGYFRIQQDASGSRLLVHQARSSAELVIPADSAREVESWIPTVFYLDAFLERLRQTLSAIAEVR